MADEAKVVVRTIPPEFYGGAAPMEAPMGQSGAAKAPKGAASGAPQGPPPSPPAPKPALGPMSLGTPRSGETAPAGMRMAPPTAKPVILLQHKKAIIIVVAVLFLAVVGAATWFYTRPPRLAAPLAPLPPAPAPEVTPPIAHTPSATTTEVVAPPASSVPPPIILPAGTYGTSSDFDQDGLTDVEEKFIATEIAKPDSDDDTYPDGTEILNLYNPRATAPERLIDSGIVSRYVNPSFGYGVYVPAGAVVAALDETTNDQVLVTFASGEYVEIRVMNLSGASFAAWFQGQFPTRSLQELQSFTNIFTEPGLRTTDGIAAFFAIADRVFALVYNPGLRQDINYKALFTMMMQSFEPVVSAKSAATVTPVAAATSTPEGAATTTPWAGESAATTTTSSEGTPAAGTAPGA